MVFLILSANYERWALPAAVLLAVPFGLLGALTAVFLRNFTNDVYFQIGLLVLIGLAAKNAILIVEFAAQEQAKGLPPLEAALEAARLRFRPIVMTSLAFVLGVLPLVLATGAGASARRSMGTGVFGGMLAATFIATVFIPLFFVLLSRKQGQAGAEPGTSRREAGVTRRLLLVLARSRSAAAWSGPITSGRRCRLPGDFCGSERGGAPAGADAVPPEWWRLFEDPMLDDLVATALANNTDVVQAVARIEEADANVRVVNSALFPQLNAERQSAAAPPSATRLPHPNRPASCCRTTCCSRSPRRSRSISGANCGARPRRHGRRTLARATRRTW